MPEPVDFRIGRISDLRLPEGANLAFDFTFTGITFSGHTATLTARRGSGAGRNPLTWSKSGLTVGASTISFDYPQSTTDDNSKAISVVCSSGATDYALTIRDGGGAIAMRLQGSITWVEEVGDFGDGSTGSSAISVSVDAGTAVTVAVTGTGHEAVTIAASAADVLSVSGQSITADDAGADKLVFWDDSAGKLTHATIGSGLTMTDTTLSAAGSEISDGSITNAKLANMAAATIKGRQSGGGTGAPEDLTATQARTALELVIGTDVLAPSGSGASLTSLNPSALATGTGAVSVVAGGSNQNVEVTPSGTGAVWLLSATSGAGIKAFPNGGLPAVDFAYSGTTRTRIIGADGGGWDISLRSQGGNGNIWLIPDGSGDIYLQSPARLASYTVGTVPTASAHTRGMIWVSNETGGATPAFSDGTDWRRVSDRAIIS